MIVWDFGQKSAQQKPNKTNQPDPFFIRAAHEKGSGYL